MYLDFCFLGRIKAENSGDSIFLVGFFFPSLCDFIEIVIVLRQGAVFELDMRGKLSWYY
jgi:hypothetical protein